MGERIDRLNAVAELGNIEDFYGLIQKDVKLLEDIDELPFVSTPLHVAASAGGLGHIRFAMEMMRLKPTFARKPDLNGYSPIHLALQGGHTWMVRRLLQVDGDLVRVKGKEGRTPLHDVAAAATGPQPDLLLEFLRDCPNSIEDVTIQNQTALHIALENNNLDAFKSLVRWLRENKSESAREILNRQDENGNTVLDVAVSKNQTEAVRVLLSDDGALSCFCHPKVITCYEFCRTKLGEMFSKTVLLFERLGIFREIILVFKRARIFMEKIVEGSRLSNDDRNALLVVAALLITITYQVVLSPPGGLWQDTQEPPLSSKDTQEPPLPSATGPASGDYHLAGTAIAQGTLPHFQIVATINYITFTLSAIMTFLLLPNGYISALFKMALVQLWVSFYYSWGVIILDTWWVWRYCLYGTGLCFVLVLLVFFGRHFFGVRIKSLYLHWVFYVVYALIMLRIVTLWSHN